MEVLPTLINLSSERNNAEVLRFLSQFDLIDYKNETFVQTCPVKMAMDKGSENTVIFLFEQMNVVDIFREDTFGNNLVYHAVLNLASYNRGYVDKASNSEQINSLHNIIKILCKHDVDKAYYHSPNECGISAKEMAKRTGVKPILNHRQDLKRNVIKR